MAQMSEIQTQKRSVSQTERSVFGHYCIQFEIQMCVRRHGATLPTTYFG